MFAPSLKAIIIGVIPYSDSSKIVKVLTREHGVLPVFVRVSKKTSTYWHPLSVLEFTEVKRKMNLTNRRIETLINSTFLS